jgi:hypothetical protein
VPFLPRMEYATMPAMATMTKHTNRMMILSVYMLLANRVMSCGSRQGRGQEGKGGGAKVSV